MTEAEWLACVDPEAILVFLKGRVSNRKFLLYAVGYMGCVEHSDQSLDTPDGVLHARMVRKSRRRIELAARYADGTVCAEDIRRVWGRGLPFPMCPLAWAVELVRGNWLDILYIRIPPGEAVQLLRDVFGNPFLPVSFSPSWRTSAAVSLAAQMYESRDFSAMPVLADALEEAGCDSADVLAHCREPGKHASGCWVVDLILSKE